MFPHSHHVGGIILHASYTLYPGLSVDWQARIVFACTAGNFRILNPVAAVLARFDIPTDKQHNMMAQYIPVVNVCYFEHPVIRTDRSSSEEESRSFLAIARSDIKC